jgi:hypothetical protein
LLLENHKGEGSMFKIFTGSELLVEQQSNTWLKNNGGKIEIKRISTAITTHDHGSMGGVSVMMCLVIHYKEKPTKTS